MTYLACGFIFGFWVGFFYSQKTKPVQAMCKCCHKWYLKNPYTGDFCSFECSYLFRERDSK